MSDKDGRHRCVSNVSTRAGHRYFCVDCLSTTNDDRGVCKTPLHVPVIREPRWQCFGRLDYDCAFLGTRDELVKVGRGKTQLKCPLCGGGAFVAEGDDPIADNTKILVLYR